MIYKMKPFNVQGNAGLTLVYELGNEKVVVPHPKPKKQNEAETMSFGDAIKKISKAGKPKEN